MANSNSDIGSGSTGPRPSFPLPLDCCVAYELCRFWGIEDNMIIMLIHTLFSPQGGPVSVKRLFTINPAFTVCLEGVYYASPQAIRRLVSPDLCFHIEISPGGFGHCTQVTRLMERSYPFAPSAHHISHYTIGTKKAESALRYAETPIGRMLDKVVARATDGALGNYAAGQDVLAADAVFNYIKSKNIRDNTVLNDISKHVQGGQEAVERFRRRTARAPVVKGDNPQKQSSISVVKMRKPAGELIPPAGSGGSDSSGASSKTTLMQLPRKLPNIRVGKTTASQKRKGPQVVNGPRPDGKLSPTGPPANSERSGAPPAGDEGGGGAESVVLVPRGLESAENSRSERAVIVDNDERRGESKVKLEIPAPIAGREGAQTSYPPPRLLGPVRPFDYRRYKQTAFTNDFSLTVLDTGLVPGLQHIFAPRGRSMPANIIPEVQRALTAVGTDILEYFADHFPAWSFAEVGGDGYLGAERPNGAAIPQYGPLSLRYPIDPEYPQVSVSPELEEPDILFVFVHYQNFNAKGTGLYQVRSLCRRRSAQQKITYVLTHALILGSIPSSTDFYITRPSDTLHKLQGRTIGEAEGPGPHYETYESERNGTLSNINYSRERWVGGKDGYERTETVTVWGSLLGYRDLDWPGGRKVRLMSCKNESLVFTYCQPVLAIGRSPRPTVGQSPGQCAEEAPPGDRLDEAMDELEYTVSKVKLGLPLDSTQLVNILDSLNALRDFSVDLEHIGVSVSGLYASDSITTLQTVLLKDGVILPAKVAMPVIATISNEFAQSREMRLSTAHAHGSRCVVQEFEDDPVLQVALYAKLPVFIACAQKVMSAHYERHRSRIAVLASEMSRRYDWENTPAFSVKRVGMAIGHPLQRFIDSFVNPDLTIVETSIVTQPSVCRGYLPLKLPSKLEFQNVLPFSWKVSVHEASSKLTRAERRGEKVAAVFIGDEKRLSRLRCSGHCTHKATTQYLGVGLDTFGVLSSACVYEQVKGFMERQIGYTGIVPTRDTSRLYERFSEAMAGAHPGFMNIDLDPATADVIMHATSKVKPLQMHGGGLLDSLFTPLTIKEWTQRTGSKCIKQFLELSDLKELNPNFSDVCTVKVFVKREYIGLGGAVTEPVTKPGRIISDRHKDMKTSQLTLASSISKVLGKVAPGYSVYKRRSDIEAELTLHLTKFPGDVTLTGDFSKQDAHTTSDMKLTMGECFRLVLMLTMTDIDRKRIVDTFVETFRRSKKSLFTVAEFLFVVLGTVGSGDLTTTVGNTLSSKLILLDAVVEMNQELEAEGLSPLDLTQVCLQFTGDDSLITLHPRFAARLAAKWSEVAAGYGHDLKVALTGFDQRAESCSAFCSKLYYTLGVDPMVRSMRMVGRALIRFPTTAIPGAPQDPFHKRNVNLLIAKLYSEKADNGFGTPVLAGMLEGFASRPDVAERIATMRKHHFKGLKLDHSQQLWILGSGETVSEGLSGPEERLRAARRVASSMVLLADVTPEARLGLEQLSGMSPSRQIHLENILRARCSSMDVTRMVSTSLFSDLMVAGLV